MRVGLVMITHNRIGQELIATATTIHADHVPPIDSISIPAELDPAELGGYADRIRNTIADASAANGALVLTDLYGATPNNLARYFAEDSSARVVSGVNLPMLLRILNYANFDLDRLVEIATEGGKKGIVEPPNPGDKNDL